MVRGRRLHVASHSVMVHYYGWSAKWNEGRQDSGRLRVRHSAKQDLPLPPVARAMATTMCALCARRCHVLLLSPR